MKDSQEVLIHKLLSELGVHVQPSTFRTFRVPIPTDRAVHALSRGIERAQELTSDHVSTLSAVSTAEGEPFGELLRLLDVDQTMNTRGIVGVLEQCVNRVEEMRIRHADTLRECTVYKEAWDRRLSVRVMRAVRSIFGVLRNAGSQIAEIIR